jgi:F-type H+-transporting ATPase subunit a
VKTRAIILGALVFTVAAFAISVFVIKAAKPVIEIRGEPLIKISGDGSGMFDVVILNTLFSAWVIMALLLVTVFLIVRKRSLVPAGAYNALEAVIEFIDGFCESIAGAKNGRRFFALVATLLIYIAFANWFSLIPVFNTIGFFEPLEAEKPEFHEKATVFKDVGGLSLVTLGAEDIKVDASACDSLTGEEAVSCRETAIEEATANKVGANEKVGILVPYLRGINTDLMTPLSFALVSMFLVQWWGVTSLGFFRYASKFINFRGPIDFLVGILEGVAELAKIISFSFRLFGNLLAGEILLLVMTALIPVVSTLLVLFYGLELFVGLIQAFVFAALTLVFASLAVVHHGGEDHHEHTEEAPAEAPLAAHQ